MFERSRKPRSRDSAAVRSSLARREAGLPDLSAIPPFPAEIPGGLAAVDPALIGDYIGAPVVAVNSLAVDATATPPEGHPLGALITGQHNARKARLRDSGMSEDQIELMVSAISEAATQYQQNAWNVVFEAGRRASVQVFALGDSQSDFAGYKARYDQQVVNSHHLRNPLLDGRVHGIPEAHYETYRMGSVVVAMGRQHEAVVKSGPLHVGHAEWTLAALAALGLWAVEG